MNKIMCIHCSHKIDKCPNCGEPFDQMVNRHVAKEERRKIVAMIRCQKTGNPWGTDTVMLGYVCPCASCQLANRIEQEVSE